jgi:CubicO group peptidase (beta-lactamase class C family)
MSALDLASLLREHASRHSIPGAAIGILRNGRVTTAYTGVADVATGEQVTSETRFAVGSLGKSMVATAIARLAEAGGLSLDDRIPAHVPELRGVGWAERATLRDLLANRSRLPLRVETEFPALSEDDDDVLSRVAANVATGEPAPPIWSYSNAGWSLLGRALETVTGLTWEEAMRANLLAPFELDQTTFATAAIAEHRAAGHDATADGPVPAEPWAPRSLAPAGSTLLSTATDLLRFAGRHLDDPSLTVLRAPHATIRIHGWFDAWCLGWAQFDWSHGPVWGWDGVISGQRSILRLLPDRRGAAVLLTNSGAGRAMYRTLFPDLMRAWFGVEVPALLLEASPGAAGDLSRFAGVYAWPDRRWEVKATDTCLAVERVHDTVEALPIDDRTFLVDADDPDTPTITFGAFGRDGRPGALYQMLWGLARA